MCYQRTMLHHVQRAAEQQGRVLVEPVLFTVEAPPLLRHMCQQCKPQGLLDRLRCSMLCVLIFLRTQARLGACTQGKHQQSDFGPSC